MKSPKFLLVIATFLLTAPVLADDAPTYTGIPYNEQPSILPAIIQAEEYDIAPDAKSGVTFGYDRDGNKNDVRKTPDAIGMARMGGDHVSIAGEAIPSGAYLGWTQTGQWMKYSVRVPESGVYRFGGQFAAAGNDGLLSATFTPLTKGADITIGPLEIPTTSGFQPNVEVYHVWRTEENLAEVNLPKGDYLLTVKIERNAGLNLDYFSFVKKP